VRRAAPNLGSCTLPDLLLCESIMTILLSKCPWFYEAAFGNSLILIREGYSIGTKVPAGVSTLLLIETFAFC
jgi:hypothetical protein